MSPATERPYPKLTPEAKARVLAELALQYQMGNLRPLAGQQLELPFGL